MSDRLLVSTRKGLFRLDRSGSGWAVAETGFVGDNVTLSHHDPLSGMTWAALDHGHFGVKLHRSQDLGESWEEVQAPAYPERPEGEEEEKE